MSHELVLDLINLFLLTFVLTSMFGTGLSLTAKQVIDPLKNWKLVALAVVANFVIVPALAYGLGIVLNLNDGMRGGLILLGACAGAPFLPKLATIAKGNLALSVGLMVLLMVLTVVYAPIVLPLLIPGASVSPWAIARPLIFLMLLPLGIGMFVRGWQPNAAAALAPHMNQASSVSLILMAVLGLLVGFQNLMAAYGTGAFAGAGLLIAGALITGFLLGSGGRAERAVTGLAAGQRNISAALLVAAGLRNADMILIVLVGSAVGFGILFLAAGLLGRRAGASAATPGPAAAD